MEFYTRYDALKQKPSKLDEHDHVDRLSYVDSTKMVQRMIQEGQNLMAFRAAALTRGQYKLEDLKEDETLPAMSVFEEDPVIRDQKLDAYKKELNSRKVKAESEKSVSMVPSDDVVKTDTKVDD